MRYNWEQKDWPNFTYTTTSIMPTLLHILRNEGKYDALLATLPQNLKADTVIDLMVVEAIKSSEIEGEFFSREVVLSAIKKNLGVQQ